MGAVAVSGGAIADVLPQPRVAGVRARSAVAPRTLPGLAWIGGGCIAIAAVSLLLPVAPAYDPWAWLLWGREVTRLELSTAQGPAFKPLPVALTALMAPFGAAAPMLWLLVARAGALAALASGFVVARRLAGGGAPGAIAGAAAATGIALTDGFLIHAAVGNGEPLFIALALCGLATALAGRHGWGLALGAAAALMRPEAWPFLAAYGAWRAWLDPRLRPAILLGAVAISAAWLVPEWLASGDPLRSGARAQVPNPGAPALADRPVIESLARAAGLLFVPTAIAALAARGRLAWLPAGAGAAWLALVALMAEAGFSGEERYLLPGAALISVSGGVGLARLVGLGRLRPGAALALATVAAIPFVAARAEGLAGLGPRLSHQAAFANALPDAIEAAGGRDRLLACGPPAVGRFRGPLLAYHLDLEKRRVRADGGSGAVNFRSRLRAGDPLEPGPLAGARRVAANRHWRIEGACGIGGPVARKRTHGHFLNHRWSGATAAVPVSARWSVLGAAR